MPVALPPISLSSGPAISGGGAVTGGVGSTGEFSVNRDEPIDTKRLALIILPVVLVGGLLAWKFLK